MTPLAVAFQLHESASLWLILLQTRQSGIQAALQYGKIKPELNDCLIDTAYDWYNEVKSDFSTRLSASIEDAKTGIDSAEGEYTESWTTGHLWWKQYHSEQVTTANVSAIKNSIDDYIDDYNFNLPHYMDTQVYRLTKKVMMTVQKVWTDKPTL